MIDLHNWIVNTTRSEAENNKSLAIKFLVCLSV